MDYRSQLAFPCFYPNVDLHTNVDSDALRLIRSNHSDENKLNKVRPLDFNSEVQINKEVADMADKKTADMRDMGGKVRKRCFARISNGGYVDRNNLIDYLSSEGSLINESKIKSRDFKSNQSFRYFSLAKGNCFLLYAWI